MAGDTHAPTTRTLPDSTTPDIYQTRISKLQKSRGPHDVALLDPLLARGRDQFENGLHDDAGKTLNAALYIHRVNLGLYDMGQLPILELLIENNIQRKDWRAVNDSYHRLDWLHRRNDDIDAATRLAALDKLIAWHLLATGLDAGPHPGEHFLTLLDLHQRALKIVEDNPVLGRKKLANRLYRLALVHYYIAIAVQRGAPVGQYLAGEFDPIQKGGSYQTASEKIARKQFRKSRRLVVRMTALYDHEKTVRGADGIARLYLADWDLLFNRRASARRGYAEACAMLLAAGFTREEINAFFEKPQVLPRYEFSPELMLDYVAGAEHVSASAGNQETPVTVLDFTGWSRDLPGVKFPRSAILSIVATDREKYSLVSFNLMKDGLAENIRVSNGDPEKSLPRRDTYEAIWSAQFRPPLQDGRLVELSGIQTRFYMPGMTAIKQK